MGYTKGVLHLTFRWLVFLWLSLAISSCFTSCSFIASASTVKIGALFDFNSTIGKAAAQMLQLAIQNVNNASDFLNSIQLELELADSNCDPIQGAASAMALVKKGVVAIIGPQSSVVSHFVAHIGRATNIPILSFAATDSSLSEQQYSYFYRIAPSDAMQMEAVAAFIAYFGWKDVAVIYTDDDYGASGASALNQSLQERGSRVVDLSLISPDTNTTFISEELDRLDNSKSRVFVLHTQEKLGFRILSEAQNLAMFTSGYVWIVTDLVANGMVRPNLSPSVAQSLKGLVGIRRYISPSPQVHDLLIQWREKYPDDMQIFDLDNLNAYGLYAYDAVYAIAHAISSHLAQGHNKFQANFSKKHVYQNLKVLESGAALRENIKNATFDGTSGHIQFNEMGDIKDPIFAYVNMEGKNPVVVAYWANKTNISMSPSQPPSMNLTHGALPNLTLVWPGNNSGGVPQGWVLPRIGAALKIGVPSKSGYSEIVGKTHIKANRTQFTGFCIEVFETAVRNLSYAVSFEYIEVLNTNGVNTNPNYDDLPLQVSSQKLDAVVGDITITADRVKWVDFTQPFIESGLVVLVPRNIKQSSDRWAFLRPYSVTMWVAIIGFTVFTSFIIFILEHQINEEFRGPMKEKCGLALWFVFSTFFRTHKEGTRSFLGRLVLILWLFVGLILTTSYTASLTAILTVQQLTPDIQGLNNLLTSKLPIGYQAGSFVKRYLVARNVSPDRLRELASKADYKEALEKGPRDKDGVAAIVDEVPYVQMFLQSYCDKYTIIGEEFEKSGWGFAFPRGSEIVQDLSEQILRMSETGELARIHDDYFKPDECNDDGVSAEGQANQLGIKSFWVLFLIVGITAFASAMTYLILLVNRGRFLHPSNFAWYVGGHRRRWHGGQPSAQGTSASTLTPLGCGLRRSM